MFVRTDTGEVVTPELRHSVMMFSKVLFKLNIIDEVQVLNMAAKFRILFV